MSAGAGRLPDVGTLVIDTVRDRIGTFQTVIDGEAWLRPVGGGYEWSVKVGLMRRATRDERLKAERRARRRDG
ncbi:hypothetical protein ACIPPJ_27085 [Streptomyces sp. NPDC086091]|uniref:hypothetical protein n=1 Tax=Streptomyces sp. NPDC086091 TaxID=3365751 RepID=UPI003815AD50